MTRPRLRVVCIEHDNVMARVLEADQGLAFEVKRPLFAGELFVQADGLIARGLGKTTGSRLRQATERVNVLLWSQEADRYTASDEHWGTLPAWCDHCGEERWIDVQVLRTTRGTLRV